MRFLAAQGARVTLTDLKSAAELSESLDQIAGLSLEALRFGEHREEDFTSADLIVASPAIRPDHPCLEAAWIELQMNWTVSAKLTGARMPVMALCAGW